jgi:hypothetical protein
MRAATQLDVRGHRIQPVDNRASASAVRFFRHAVPGVDQQVVHTDAVLIITRSTTIERRRDRHDQIGFDLKQPGDVGASAQGALAPDLAGDAETGVGDGFESITRDRVTARFAQPVGAAVHASQCGVDVVDRLAGAGRRGAGELPFQDAVDVAMAGELRDSRIMCGDERRLFGAIGNQQYSKPGDRRGVEMRVLGTVV